MSEPFWTPLGGQPVDWEGDYNPSYQYLPGDVVIYRGVPYLAVNPSLGSTPPLSAYSFDVGPEVAYAEITSNLTVSATTEAGATPIVTAPAFTADGNSQYLVEFFAPIGNTPAAAGAFTVYCLFLDGVTQGYFGEIITPSAGITAAPVRLTRRITPAAGSHVLSVRGYVSTGSAIVYAGTGAAGLYSPAFLRVTKVPSLVSPGMGGLVPPLSVVTALPASPVDGQEILLVDSLTAPTYQWHLKYLAAKASNKWVYIGGIPARHDIATQEAIAQGGSDIDLATRGPTITPPVTGQYVADFGYSITGTGIGRTFCSLWTATTQGGIGVRCVAASDYESTAGSLTQNLTGGVELRMRYQSPDVSGLSTYNRYLRLTPVAVGG